MGRYINILTGTVLAMILVLLLGRPVNAEGTITEDYLIEPGKDAGMPIPISYDRGYDIKITSDRPVTVYIMSQTQWMNTALTGNYTDYESMYEGVTSKTVSYDYGDNPTELYYVIIHNPDPTEFANTRIEIDYLQEIAEDLGDSAKDSICGSTILLGICVLGGLISILYLLKRE